MNWIPWVQRIALLFAFITYIVLGAKTSAWPYSISFILTSIILMLLAFCTKKIKCVSGLFFFLLTFVGTVYFLVSVWTGVVYWENEDPALVYLNCFILLIIILLLYHYYYTQWRYEGLIQKDDFNKSNGRVHILYLGHNLFLLIVSSIMLIVNACFVNNSMFFIFLCWYFQLLNSDILRIFGVIFGYFAQKQMGVYFCTCYYRPMCTLASIIGLLQSLQVFVRFDLDLYKDLQYCNAIFEVLFLFSAFICNQIMKSYHQYKFI